MVLGPDGKPCKACNSRTAFFKSSKYASKTAGAGALTPATTPSASSNSSSTGANTTAHCPADVEQLGRATWTFLHTTAAYYPEKPTTSQRANILSLLHSLPVLYPCSHCASHLGEEMKIHPPDVSGRKGLSWWLCQRHNDVNARLGKAAFDCNKTDERWKDGPADGSCD
ncbi:ERV/ALR sulfhydryl oxidase domain-containing protein [Amylostereum chailletii]|nr:ERV/ALR sulfhydryl oxidase domain-containing protein [Amylostereum chailletii]